MPGPRVPGSTLIRFQNEGALGAALVLALTTAPHTAQDIVTLAQTFRPETDQPPSWVTILAGVTAPPTATSWGFAQIPATTVVPICEVGNPPALVTGDPVEWTHG